jgi:hypothetical protein
MQPNDQADANQRRAPAGVPRRFGISKLLLITALFSVIFAILRSFEAEPIVFVGVGIFFAVVGVAQAVLFHGKRPRLASMVAGFVFIWLWLAVMSFYDGRPMKDQSSVIIFFLLFTCHLSPAFHSATWPGS